MLNTNPRGGRSECLLKRKGVADTFPIKFFQGLSSLHSEITLPIAKLCYALFFFLQP